MARREIETLETDAVRAAELFEAGGEEERVSWLVALGRALSDPIRVRMLGVLAAARAVGRRDAATCRISACRWPARKTSPGSAFASSWTSTGWDSRRSPIPPRQTQGGRAGAGEAAREVELLYLERGSRSKAPRRGGRTTRRASSRTRPRTTGIGEEHEERLISDVHSNLPALEAVLSDIGGREEVEGIYHLEDLVGYAPWPNEMVALLRELRIRGSRATTTRRGSYRL